MNFKKKADGSYFPPILPNGDFIGVAYGGVERQELFTVRDDGIYASGLFYLWSEISGVSITDERGVELHSDKYRNGGIAFYLGVSALRDANGNLVTRISGYEVDYCLMNRISFERRRLNAVTR